MSFTVTKREIVFKGRVFTIIRDEVRHESGYDSVREVVQHDGGAVVAAVFPDLDVLLIRQFRYPIQDTIYELPAGKLNPGEDPAACASRELIEETGWRASELQPLVSMLTTPGFCSEVLHLFLAQDLHEDRQRLEEGEESIEIERVQLSEALRMCSDGRIVDGKTITGLFLAATRLGVVPAGVTP